jgi:hypothetical protein
VGISNRFADRFGKRMMPKAANRRPDQILR